MVLDEPATCNPRLVVRKPYSRKGTSELLTTRSVTEGGGIR
jgi:hypothetical protein